MWDKIKLIWTAIQPELIRFLKAAIKFGIDVLLPIAIDAVINAERKGNAEGWTGPQKLEYAASEIMKRAPAATVGKAITAAQSAWLIKETEGWKD